MSEGIVLSLFDYSGNFVQPWAEAGYDCVCVDVKHEGDQRVVGVGNSHIEYISADITDWIPPREDYAFVAAFPPCTNLAVSGARWFKDKGLDGLTEGIQNVEAAREICEWADAPWFIENPVSTLSTYWREPDFTFHPYEFDEYTDEDEAYSKKTCLWTGAGFVMPDVHGVEEYDDRIHRMPPSEDRSEKRSETPRGFSNAVYEVNHE
jgi:hypothetical protein